MSDTDSFIEEVTEEVRREKLYGYLRRYGWIAVVAILLIVGGAAFSEWRKAQATAQAEQLGDALIAALTRPDAQSRADAVSEVQAETVSAQAALSLIAATELAAVGSVSDAVERLGSIAENGNIPEIYRHLAGFKSLLLQADTATRAERRAGFESFARPGHPMRMLAEEQLALIRVESGDVAGALAQFQAILQDAEASADLQQRAMQVIVALGGEPDLSALSPENEN